MEESSSEIDSNTNEKEEVGRKIVDDENQKSTFFASKDPKESRVENVLLKKERQTSSTNIH